VHGHVPGDIAPQGSGSGLDADLLDGVDSKVFARTDHNHDGRYSLVGHTHPSSEITGPINADTLDSLDSGDFARSGHDHPEYDRRITALEKRTDTLESNGDLSSVLDRIDDLQKMVLNLKARIADLEEKLKEASQ